MSDEEYLEDLLMVGPSSRRRRSLPRSVARLRRRPMGRRRQRAVPESHSPDTMYMDGEIVRARPSIDMEPMRVEGRRGRATRLNQAQAARRQGEEKDRRGRARDLLRSLRRRY